MNHLSSRAAPKRQQDFGAGNLQQVRALIRCAAFDIKFNARGA